MVVGATGAASRGNVVVLHENVYHIQRLTSASRVGIVTHTTSCHICLFDVILL